MEQLMFWAGAMNALKHVFVVEAYMTGKERHEMFIETIQERRLCPMLYSQPNFLVEERKIDISTHKQTEVVEKRESLLYLSFAFMFLDYDAIQHFIYQRYLDMPQHNEIWQIVMLLTKVLLD